MNVECQVTINGDGIVKPYQVCKDWSGAAQLAKEIVAEQCPDWVGVATVKLYQPATGEERLYEVTAKKIIKYNARNVSF